MKTALAKDTGTEVQAGPSSPKEALCPDCGNPVDLRHFHRNGNKYWYYRHRYGEKCGNRQETTSEGGRRPETALVTGPPFLILAVESVSRAIAAARQGDLQAVLSLAFSPLVHSTLSSLNVDPRALLRLILPEREQQAEVIPVDHGSEQILKFLEENPGPVFDLSPERNGSRELIESPWYVPLVRPWGAQIQRVRLVLEQAEHVYLLGEEGEWGQLLHEIKLDKSGD